MFGIVQMLFSPLPSKAIVSPFGDSTGSPGVPLAAPLASRVTGVLLAVAAVSLIAPPSTKRIELPSLVKLGVGSDVVVVISVAPVPSGLAV